MPFTSPAVETAVADPAPLTGTATRYAPGVWRTYPCLPATARLSRRIGRGWVVTLRVHLPSTPPGPAGADLRSIAPWAAYARSAYNSNGSLATPLADRYGVPSQFGPSSSDSAIIVCHPRLCSACAGADALDASHRPKDREPPCPAQCRRLPDRSEHHRRPPTAVPFTCQHR